MRKVNKIALFASSFIEILLVLGTFMNPIFGTRTFTFAFVLLRNKLQKTYEAMFKEIIQHLIEFHLISNKNEFSFESIHCDFELAIRNSSK